VNGAAAPAAVVLSALGLTGVVVLLLLLWYSAAAQSVVSVFRKPTRPVVENASLPGVRPSLSLALFLSLRVSLAGCEIGRYFFGGGGGGSGSGSGREQQVISCPRARALARTQTATATTHPPADGLHNT